MSEQLPWIKRRVGQPLRFKLPYSSDNRSFIRHALPARARVKHEGRGIWACKSSYLVLIADAMADDLGLDAWTTIQVKTTTCHEQCWTARGDECECRCLGYNHGTGDPWSALDPDDPLATLVLNEDGIIRDWWSTLSPFFARDPFARRRLEDQL